MVHKTSARAVSPTADGPQVFRLDHSCLQTDPCAYSSDYLRLLSADADALCPLCAKYANDHECDIVKCARAKGESRRAQAAVRSWWWRSVGRTTAGVIAALLVVAYFVASRPA
jgi:hypothetical protein